MDLEFEESKKPAGVAGATRSRSPTTGRPTVRSDRAELRKDALAITPKSQAGGTGWRLLRWCSRLGLWGGAILIVYATFYLDSFDRTLVIEDPVRLDPRQEAVDEPSFDFDYRGTRYRIQPVANYDISGLIVTHNDISSITDAYHTSDAVDFRDICVVWGANVGSGTFRRLKFWSEPWSCHVEAANGNDFDALVPYQLSNNHLLTDDESVRRTIQKMRIGDQIRLRGRLINYWYADSPESKRSSSIIREDTGNGACEVMWVEEAEILRRGGSWKFPLLRLGKTLLVGSVVLGLLLFFITPMEFYRRPSS